MNVVFYTGGLLTWSQCFTLLQKQSVIFSKYMPSSCFIHSVQILSLVWYYSGTMFCSGILGPCSVVKLLNHFLRWYCWTMFCGPIPGLWTMYSKTMLCGGILRPCSLVVSKDHVICWKSMTKFCGGILRPCSMVVS